MGLAGGASWIFAAIVTGFFKEYQNPGVHFGRFLLYICTICLVRDYFCIRNKRKIT